MGLLLPPDEIKITIPNGSDSDFYKHVAHQLRIRSDRKPNGEVRRPVVAGDDSEDLPIETGKNWFHVKGSKYDNYIMEPEAQPADMQERNEHILSLGGALLPKRLGKVESMNWAEHVDHIDQKHGVEEPRLVIPHDWVNKTTMNKTELRKVFSSKG